MSLAVRKMPLGFRLPSVRLAWIVAAVLLLLGTATMAYAYWASITSSSNAAAAADALSPGSKPAVAANGTAVSVTWAGGTTVNGHPATGYTVTRYSEATGGTGSAATGGCAGTVTTLTCTEQSVPGGVWYYSVTPAIALWTGEESPRSTGISTDAAAPVATVQSVSPTPNTAEWNNTSPVTVTITADDGAAGSGVASITYTLDGGAQQTVSGASATVPVSGDGTHMVSYFATDNSGNAGAAQTYTVQIDTATPAAPTLTAPAYVNIANVASVGVSGTTEPGGTISLTASDPGAANSVTISATASGSGAWSASPDLTALNQGAVTYSATATDLAGNTGTAKTATGIKDTVAPGATALSVPTYVNSANVTGVRITGIAEASAAVTVTVTGSSGLPVTGTATALSGGDWSLSLNLSNLGQGTLTYTATVTDAAGNAGPAAGATNVKDTVAPALTLTAPRYVNIATAGGVQVGGNKEAGAVVDLTVTDKAGLTIPGQSSGTGTSWAATLNLTSLADGALTYAATTADAAGNITSTSTAPGPNTKDTEAPTVTAITGWDGGNAGKGKNLLEKGDTLSVTYSEAIAPGTFCTGWTGSAMNGTATVSNNGTDDTVTYSAGTCPGLSISLGADYVGSTPAVFTGNGGNASVLTWDAGTSTLTMKFGTLSSGSITNPATQGFPSYTPPGSLTDLAGNPIVVRSYSFGSRTAF